ncbi:MAG TPA: hypothetical protein VE152_10065 [Acidimicrobiales bacterium]|nr:hypothetical protein [Acidimicrobiales bacterium]
MAEVEAEVRRRRSAGELPRSVERQAGAGQAVQGRAGDLDALLAALGEAGLVRVDPVPSGGRPLERLAQRALGRAMFWYVNYVAVQVGDLEASVTRLARLLAEAVAGLAGDPGLRPAPPPGPPPDLVDLSGWRELVLRALAGARGRVLHAESGDAGLLGALVGAGVDAYGVDPRPPALAAAEARGLEAWAETAPGHLAAVGDASLGGLVLSGWVDRLGPGHHRWLADRLGAVLAPGGTVVVLGTAPGTSAGDRPPPEADLAGSRPLHARSWAHLLRAGGVDPVAIDAGPGSGPLAPVPGEGPTAAVLNAAFARAESALWGPGAFAVIGIRQGGGTPPPGATVDARAPEDTR